ncbi:MAG: two pore domain potassium channel family protein [Bacteroidales bacterium]|nr:two pore domain potassium channel family protein [Bacteroidales bacterium]
MPTRQPSPTVQHIILAVRLIVLAGAGLLVGIASYDTFTSHSFVGSAFYEKMQLWICSVFFADLVIEWILSDDRRHFFHSHIFFLLLCIPYVAVFRYFGFNPGAEVNFLLALVPVFRAAFVLAAVLTAFNAGRANSLFSAYIMLLLFMLYICSMMFFVAEGGINPGVHSYRSAVYWAVMSMTTTGSQITEYTNVGRALATVLSAMGLILFPVFTVYVSNAISGRSGSDTDQS